MMELLLVVCTCLVALAGAQFPGQFVQSPCTVPDTRVSVLNKFITVFSGTGCNFFRLNECIDQALDTMQDCQPFNGDCPFGTSCQGPISVLVNEVVLFTKYVCTLPGQTNPIPAAFLCGVKADAPPPTPAAPTTGTATGTDAGAGAGTSSGAGSGSGAGGASGAGSGSGAGGAAGAGSGSGAGGAAGAGTGSGAGGAAGAGTGSGAGGAAGAGSGSGTGGAAGAGTGSSAGGAAGAGTGSSAGGAAGAGTGSSTGGAAGAGTGSGAGGAAGAGVAQVCPFPGKLVSVVSGLTRQPVFSICTEYGLGEQCAEDMLRDLQTCQNDFDCQCEEYLVLGVPCPFKCAPMAVAVNYELHGQGEGYCVLTSPAPNTNPLNPRFNTCPYF